MTTGQKIYECRKGAGLTQEELAEKLGVSRQAVSKWESDAAFPETENILELCKLFHVSSDELLFGKTDEEKAPASEEDGRGKTWGVIDHGGKRQFEYISKRRVLGMPLVHINLGHGCRAHGIFAFGVVSSGFVSAGILSAGFLSFGVLALGLVALGSFVLGVLSFGVLALGLVALGSFVLGVLSFGGVSLGVLAFGGIAVGTMCFGGVAVGNIAVGGLAVGKYAVGDWASGWCAAGVSHAGGTHPFVMPDGLNALKAFLEEHAPAGLADMIFKYASGLS